MGLLSLFQHGTLSIEWAYNANGTIWRVHFTRNGQIIGECREREKKVASFFCVDERSGRPLWQNLVLSEPWWVGIEGVVHDVVLLHSYAKPDMPEHKGILAHDSQTGRQLWHNDDVSFWFVHDNTVYVYRDFFERRVGYGLDLRTGECRQTFDGSLAELQSLRHQASEPQMPTDVVLPEILTEGTKEGKLLPLVSKTIKGKVIVGNVEFVKEQEFLIFNYHVQPRNAGAELPAYENQLFVLHLPQGRRMFFDTIGRNLTAPVPDSFFMKSPRLFFVKDQHLLTSVRLWKS